MQSEKRFYITTAIDYPNNRPHIGHALEKIGADIQARFRRMEGYAVHFLMGNDENTIKVSQRAEELGVAPKPYVDDMARQFQEVWKALEISNDDFIQTSEDRHHRGCQEFIQRVYDAGDIYKKAYKALYCDGCEEFKTPKDLIDGKCPNHPNRTLRELEEENYFFRLSAFADRLLAHYAAHPEFIQPESRRNEIVSLVKSGLQDVSISRKGFTWGIPVPFDAEQTIYVWFDALLNYITAIGFGTDQARFESLWPADVHVIGKDITRFHCALWPAMLMSAGLPLPRQVFGHGFVYLKGEKISKSLGNVVDPMDLIQGFSAEAFRFYFASQCPFGGDGEFTYDRFADVYNSALADNLGNLYSRTLSMAVRVLRGQPRRRLGDRRNGLACGPEPLGPRRGAPRADRSLRIQRRDPADLVRGPRPREPVHPDDRALQGREDRPRGGPRDPREPGRGGPDHRHPDQAVPAADGRDVLPRVRCRRRTALGVDLVCERPRTAEGGRPEGDGPARQRQANATVPQDRGHGRLSRRAPAWGLLISRYETRTSAKNAGRPAERDIRCL